MRPLAVRLPLGLSTAVALTFGFWFLKRAATRGRMFRKPIQVPVSRRPDAVSKEVQAEPAVPPITSEAIWDGHFPDADRDVQASIEYSNQGLRELLANDTLIVTRSVIAPCTCLPAIKKPN